MVRLNKSSLSTLLTWARIFIVSVFLGCAYYIWGYYQQGLLQSYEALVEVPITARSDILQLYSKSPFQKVEIEFPPAEISSSIVIRVWVARNIAPVQVEADLNQFLTEFYATSQSRFHIVLSALGLEITALKAEEHAKAFELNYLRKHYAELREQRIEHLDEELNAIKKRLDEKRHTFMLAQTTKNVKIQALNPVTSRRMAIAWNTQSLLTGLFFFLLQALWLQKKHTINVLG
jgi:hypothetical protein